MDLTVGYWQYNIGLALGSLWGNTTNLFLTNFSHGGSALTLPTDDGILYVGEEFTLDGRNLVMLGSGTAQPGLDILPLGPEVDLILFEDTDTGHYILVFPDGEPNFLSFAAMHIEVEEQAYSATYAGADPICFCSGTRIDTPDGPRRIEDIRAGDRLRTSDGGMSTVLWAGARQFDTLPKHQRPIVIRPQSQFHGARAPQARFEKTRALRLSPQHRVQIGQQDGTPLLAPAKALLGEPGIHQVQRDAPVTYHHILLDRHVVVVAEGVCVETLLLAKGALASLGPRSRLEIMNILGCTRETLADQPQARPAGRLMTLREAKAHLRATERPLALSAPTRSAAA